MSEKTAWITVSDSVTADEMNEIADQLGDSFGGQVIVTTESIDFMDESERRKYVEQLTNVLE